MPSRKRLARRLEAVADFSNPSIALEQYLTPPEIAAHVLHLADLQGDLRERTVVDLGTGTGVFAIGAALAGAERVVGLDVDRGALQLASENETRVWADVDQSRDDARSPVDWVCADASRPPLSLSDATVLSNPPFGAQRGNRHADRDFLEAASALGRVSYTVHNEGSREFVESFAADAGGTVTHAFRATFDLERRFDFHADDHRELEAEVFRIEWPAHS